MEICQIDEEYTLGSIWDHFQKVKPKSGEEIAEDLKQTRANVSRILKKIFGQTFYMIKNEEPELGPFEIAVHIAKMFGVDFSVEKEVKKFFTLFPPDIKELIKQDGTQRHIDGLRRLAALH